MRSILLPLHHPLLLSRTRRRAGIDILWYHPRLRNIVGAAIVAISLLMMFPLWLSPISIVLLLPYLLLHISTYKDMAIIDEGRELNKTLGKTARNMFVFGLSTAIAIVLCSTLI